MKEFKVGQTVWSSLDGEVVIGGIDKSHRYPVQVENTEDHLLDGRMLNMHKHPSLFHSKQDMIDYFTNLKEKKTFTRWVNLYDTGIVSPFETEGKALVFEGATGYVKTIKIEWECEE